MTFSERVLTEEDNTQEDAFDQVAKIIAEAEEKIMGTDEERKERERINEEVFQRNISRRLKDVSLWFQFHLSFDKKKDFSELEKEKLKFWKSWLFRNLEGLEKDHEKGLSQENRSTSKRISGSKR